MVEENSPKPRILIADDRPQGVELLEVFLSDLPVVIASAVNGEETLRMVRDWHPDIILLDVMMPKTSGFEVCRQLRNNPETESIGIIMITALDQISDIDRAVEAGTDDFLTKPINRLELIYRVRALLEARSITDRLLRTLTYIARLHSQNLPGEPSQL